MLSTHEISQALGLHRSTVTRQIRKLGNEVLSVGSGPQLKHLLRREIPGLGSQWPAYQVDEQGKAHFLGTIHALHGGMWQLAFENPKPAFTDSEFKHGIFPGLPWFFDDMRPQGFLGRAFARRYGEHWGFPQNPEDWNNDQAFTALVRAGENALGAFIIGDQAIKSFYAACIDESGKQDTDLAVEFPKRAESALEFGEGSSSAGGEQQKFAITVVKGGQPSAVIVKFTPPFSTGSEPAQRWRDLLRAEQLAGKLLQSLAVDTVSSTYQEYGGRAFLTVDRFDRIGDHGRRSVVSLRALDAAFFGFGNRPWNELASDLLQDGWIDTEGATAMRRIHWFGQFIGNSDMHYGNLSFFLSDEKPLRLCPVYDMLPMLFRPTAQGELPPQTLNPQYPTPREFSDASAALSAALNYWQTIAKNNDFSDPFRTIAQESMKALSAIKRIF